MSPFAFLTTKLRTTLDRLTAFGRDEDGSIGIMFGGAIVVMVLFLGAAVDFGTAFMAREGLQDALDSAALAAGRELETGGEKEDAETKAKEVFAANLPDGVKAELSFVDVNADAGQVTLQAQSTLETSFLRVAGMNTLDIDAEAVVNTSSDLFEVVLVLDGSSNMTTSDLASLKTAAHALVAALFGDKTISNNIKVGVVPFAAMVNVGPSNSNTDWIDTDGRSSVHFENMSEQVNRFDLLDRMQNVSWAGCVEVRPGDHGIKDTEATIDDPDSLFVPSFAPDEPDVVNADNNDYYNSYLPDDGGSCAAIEPTCVRRDHRRRCIQYVTATLEPSEAQNRLCKYDNVSVTSAPVGKSFTGPNHMCDSTPITPLTSNRTAVDSAIDALIAQGGTNTAEGVMWGWRVLSSQAPFTEGADKNLPNVRKIMVVMSGGENELVGLDNHNNSYFSPWGFGSTKRLNPNSQTTQSLSNSIDEKTNHACQNAGKDGVTIYSVAYNLDGHPSTRALLKRCASHPQKAYEAGSESELIRAFEAIGLDLNSLRISS